MNGPVQPGGPRGGRVGIDILGLERPRLRGRLHLLAAVASVAGLVVLLRVADTPLAATAAWVYGTAGVLLYASSGVYHVFTRSPRGLRVMQRIDRSMIYVLIAGTFTPFGLLVLEGGWRWATMTAMWGGAVLGAALTIAAYDRFRKLSAALYLVLGWAGLVILPPLADRPALFALVLLGGCLYTGGAVLFALRRPVLSPRWFGYHEVWHAVCVAAGAVLYLANFTLVRGA
jgi:hemolysin III